MRPAAAAVPATIAFGQFPHRRSLHVVVEWRLDLVVEVQPGDLG
jgi:hypothetical protein